MQLKTLWPLLMAAGLFSSSCTVTIHDFPVCAPYPDGGAHCNNFLTPNPQSLTEAQWEALQASWLAAGGVLECTTSTAIAQNKAEVEKLCTVYSCTEAQLTAKKKLLEAMTRVQN